MSRTEFANLLLNWKPGQRASRDLFQSQPDYPPSGDQMWLCWPDEGERVDGLPRLVILADNSLSDFFAWAITFLPAYRPLTSFFRVLPWTVYAATQQQRGSRLLDNKAVLAGLVLAETLANGAGRGFVDLLPMTAYETTYSYAAGRALSLGYDEEILPYLFKGWQSVREIDSRERRLPGDLLSGIWNVIPSILKNGQSKANFDARGINPDLLRACEEVSERGQISIQSLDRLSQGRVPPHLFTEVVKFPREQRVVTFENTIRQLAYGASGEPAINFVVGYLASLVSEGSLEYSRLVFPIQFQFPTAMLWYGVCAGLSPGNRVLTDYGYLGLRILRMLEREENLMTHPTSDILLAELEVFLLGQPRSRIFRQNHASSLRIELVPGVTTLARSSGSHSMIEQPGLFGEETRQSSAETERLRELVKSIKNSLSLAEGMLSNKSDSSGGSGAQLRSKRKR